MTVSFIDHTKNNYFITFLYIFTTGSLLFAKRTGVLSFLHIFNVINLLFW